jgi:signal transduction histidine kinase
MTERPTLSAAEEKRQAALALLGELTGSVAHEFNNILNNIMLHLAVLEKKGLSAELNAETAQVKQVGRQAAALVKQLQQYSNALQPPLQPTDPNQVVSENVREPVRYELAADLPPVLGNPADLRRIVELLVANAVAVSSRPDEIVVRTGRAGAGILLQVSDSGPALAPEMQKRQFEPFVTARPGGDGVRLAVCKDVVRRMQGAIRGENRPEGGMVYTVELRSAENVA